jgi:hypothetical protein
LLFCIALPLSNAADQHCQTARRGIARNRVSGIEQAFPGEQILDPASQFLLGGRDHSRRNFFKSYFKEKVCHVDFLCFPFQL